MSINTILTEGVFFWFFCFFLLLYGATCAAGTAYLSGAHTFTPILNGVYVTQSLVLLIIVLFATSCVHCIVCPSITV
jgi:hypothetical protein